MENYAKDFGKISANNVKEINVVFNKAVDKTTAENIDAYTLMEGIGSVSLASAALQDDGKTVILTVTGTLTNQATDYTLSVTGVKAATGTDVISAKDIKFVPVDSTLPTVEKVESLGNKAIKITFSEPVVLSSSTVAASFKIDDKAVSGLATTSGHTMTVQLFNTLTSGKHTIVINNIKDYKNYELIEKSMDFDVTADTAAPTIAAVNNATLEAATVVFSEDVQPTEALTATNYYWMLNSAKKYATSVDQIDGKTYKVYFTSTNKLPAYATDLYVRNVKDYSGNIIADGSKITVTAALDQARPEVLSSIFNKTTNKSISLTFNKPVDSTTFKASNVVIKKAGVVKTNGYTATVTGKTVTINFTTALTAGSYTLDFSGMKDTTLLQNTMLPYSTTIEVADTEAPNASPTIIGTLPTYIITFDKEMDITSSYSILNSDNYYVTYNTAATAGITGKLPAGTNLAPTNDSMGVIITFPSGVTGVTKIVVQGVKDSVGNLLAGYAKEYTSFDTSLRIIAAKATGANTVLVKMNQPVGNAIATDFVVNSKVPTKAEIDATDNSIVKLTLASTDSLPSEAKVTLATASSLSGNTRGITGAALVAATTTTIDAVAPSVIMNGDGYIQVGPGEGIEVTANTLTIRFDESIAVKNQAVLDDNFKLYRADGVPLVYGLDYTLKEINPDNIVFNILSSGSKLAGQDTNLQVVFDNTNNNISDIDTYTDFDGTTSCKTYANGFDTASDLISTDVIHFDCAASTITPGTATRTNAANGTVKFTSSEAGSYYYGIVAKDATAPTIDTSAAGTACTTSETTITLNSLTTGAKDIYIVVKDASGNVSTPVKIAIPAEVVPTITPGTATRTDVANGTVKFTSSEAGSYYYGIVAKDATAPTIDTSAAGTACTTSETTITLNSLTTGAKDIYIVVKDENGNVSTPVKITIPAEI